jgi:hypothetical protein
MKFLLFYRNEQPLITLMLLLLHAKRIRKKMAFKRYLGPPLSKVLFADNQFLICLAANYHVPECYQMQVKA